MTDELKPVRCGCGGEATAVAQPRDGYTSYYCTCLECNINTDYYSTEAEAITAWNKAMGATDKNVGDKDTMYGDLIRRQDAIDAMMALKQEDDEAYGCEIPEGFDGKRAVEALEKLPSAEPEPKWIPVSKMKPKVRTDVLLQFEKNQAVGFYSNGDWNVNTGNDFYTGLSADEDKPIAWMPLPEPYRGEE